MNAIQTRPKPLAAFAILPALFLAACETVDHDPHAGHRYFVAGPRAFACGNWSAYAEDTSGYLVLEIRSSDQQGEPDQYSIQRGVEQLLPSQGYAHIYRMERKNAITEHFCNDVVPKSAILDTLVGTGGRMDVRKYDRIPTFENFRLDVKLAGVEFRGREAQVIHLDSIRLDSLAAGWLPG